MLDLCDLQIHVNGQQTFFLHQKVFSRFCGKLRKIIKEEKRRSQTRISGIDFDDFPGGPEGFELVSRFCYNNGNITITVSNVSILHCCAVSLGMTSSCNLLHQTETFLEGLFNWSWQDILTSLKACESFFSFADSCGLIQKFIYSLLAKIAQNSDVSLLFASSSSSPDTRTPTSSSSSSLSSSNKSAWWFEDMTILSPSTIEQFLKTLGAFGRENNSLVLTRFVLHYLKKTAAHCNSINNNLMISTREYTGLAHTAVHGVVLMGKTAFSCRSLFWVLRIVSVFGLSRECRSGIEELIGGLLDQATLDDLLICGHNGGAYDVNIVLRLIRLFVRGDSKLGMMKVGRLIDKYLREIAPDQSLKISKFLAIAESLPDYARDSYDEVYRAIDIYLESHLTLPLEERSRLCRCLNYDKLSLEACKDLAKNPRIPPRIAVKALASQGSGLPMENSVKEKDAKKKTSIKKNCQMVLYKKNESDMSSSASDHHHDQSPDEEYAESEHMRLNLQRMQWKVVELEKVCREMKGQMSRMVKIGAMVPPPRSRALPRLC